MNLPTEGLFTQAHLDFLVELLGAEFIGRQALCARLRAKEPITTYIGYEIKGTIHTGSLIGLGLMSYLSKFENVKAYVLLADIHTKLNGKEVNPAFKNTVEKLYLNSSASVQVIMGSDPQMHYNIEYWMGLLKAGVDQTILRTTRAARANARNETLCVKDLLYAVMQSYDIDHLQVDLAVAASDQRKIHMLHLDRVGRRACAYIHFPLLTHGGVKISKSAGHTVHTKPDQDVKTLLSFLWGCDVYENLPT